MGKRSLLKGMRGRLRQWLGLPSRLEIEAMLDLHRVGMEAHLTEREARLTNRIDSQLRGKQATLERMESQLETRYAQTERVASQTTLAVDDLLAVLVTARKEWQAAQEAESHKVNRNEEEGE